MCTFLHPSASVFLPSHTSLFHSFFHLTYTILPFPSSLLPSLPSLPSFPSSLHPSLPLTLSPTSQSLPPFLLPSLPLQHPRGYLEESINISTPQTATALQHLCWSRSALEAGRILGKSPLNLYHTFLSSPSLCFTTYISASVICQSLSVPLGFILHVLLCVRPAKDCDSLLHPPISPSYTHYISLYSWYLLPPSAFTVFLGERISECVMCATGVDLAYRTYFRILSELLLSPAVEVRERICVCVCVSV